MSKAKAIEQNEKHREETYEFGVAPNSGKVNVANLSYGEREAKNHTYTVTVQDGKAVSCTCPADTYHPGKGKHREAVEENADVLYNADPDPLAPVERAPDCSLCGGTGTTDYDEICWACVILGGGA